MDSDHWVIDVDRAACIGSGMCAALVPTHFQLVDGRSTPVRREVDADESVLDAADNCPVEAIVVRHAVTGEVLAPQA